MDSFDTYTSIYQISDRSCQTSLELLEPFVDRAIKRRKLVTQETTLSFSDGELNTNSELGGGDEDLSKNRDRKTSKMAEMLELETEPGGGPPSGLGALGNLLLLPLIATHNNQFIDSQNKKHKTPIQKENEDADS